MPHQAFTFNSKRFADINQVSANLVFICSKCGRCGRFADMGTACPSCSNTIFHVARTGIQPTMWYQLKDPYHRDKEEDGPNRNQEGGDNDPMSSSGWGQNSRSDRTNMEDGRFHNNDEISVIRHDDINSPSNSLPGDHDGLKDDIDQFNTHEQDALQSPAMSADNSPFNPMNNKAEPHHTGPFNMHKYPGLTVRKAPGSIFDRIRRKRKEILI